MNSLSFPGKPVGVAGTRQFLSWRFIARYWLPVVALCAAIWVQSSFPAPAALPRWPLLDKIMHAGVYGVLGALLCRALRAGSATSRSSARLLLSATLSAALFGLSDEWHQSFVPQRRAEAADLLADFIGAALASWSYLLAARFGPKRECRGD